MYFKHYCLLLLVKFSFTTQNQLLAQQCIPSVIQQNTIANLNLNAIKFISINSPVLQSHVDVWNGYLQQLSLPTYLQKDAKHNQIQLVLDTTFSKEAYSIRPLQNDIVEIRGKKEGVFYGLMTLLQFLFHNATKETITIGNINDQPSFSWRGMHLDVSRHFFPIAFIKKYLDIMALHKMNTFHWHLTDDQGWRIEIKKYPLLTQIGSKRKETIVEKNFDPYIGDGLPVQGFYTQEEVKEIVAYAADRQIVVVPEIEMPGHAQAALAAYPQFSCNKKPLEVMTVWGVSEDVFCTNDSTMQFVKNILEEVLTLFPSKYIHIGGDEVPKERWKKCKYCQSTIQKYKLKDEHELQSYFIKQIDKFITSKGRKIIGWDEILEGGLAPNAAVMSWRGEEGGIAAAKQKHDVVMTPGSHCYFDHYQGNKQLEPLAIGGHTPLKKVYDYEPVPPSLSSAAVKYIIGAQANMWTEYMATTDHVEYMMMPRMAALAEVLWTGKKRPGYENFKGRLKKHFNLLDAFQVHYANSIYTVRSSRKVVNDKVELRFQTEFDEGKVHYAILNVDPYVTMLDYKSAEPIIVEKSSRFKAQYFEKSMGLGHVLIENVIIHQALGKQMVSSFPPDKKYNTGGLSTLVDSKVGQLPRMNEEWLAWKENAPTLTIDLEKITSIKEIVLHSLKEEISWIYLPSNIRIELSNDNTSFTTCRFLSLQEIHELFSDKEGIKIGLPSHQSARYVRLQLEKPTRIANGKPGAGDKPWLFLSEIEIH